MENLKDPLAWLKSPRQILSFALWCAIIAVVITYIKSVGGFMASIGIALAFLSEIFQPMRNWLSQIHPAVPWLIVIVVLLAKILEELRTR